MTDFFAAVNGQRMIALSLSVPYYGAPVAEVVLATDAPLTAPITLSAGNMTLRMGIVRQAQFAGTTKALLVGGAARWSKVVEIGPYANAGGVMLRTVLSDLLTATRSAPEDASTGELLELPPDRSLGTLYAPGRAPAARILSQLAGELWWTDLDGVTHLSARPSKRVASSLNVEMRQGSKGWFTVATEDPLSWQPGNTFTAPNVPDTTTISASRFVFDGEGKLRIDVLGVDSPAVIATDPGTPTTTDRVTAAIRAFIRSEDESRAYRGIYEYAVVSADGATIDAVPVDATIAPALPRGVPYRPSLAATTCVPAAGTLALVAFVNGDPSRPVCLGFDATLPASISMADALGEVARYGDSVAVDPITGVLSFIPSIARPNKSKVSA